MKNPALKVIKIILACVAFVLFVIGVVMAGIYSDNNTPERMSGFINYCVTGVAALLTANLGAVLGITALNIRQNSNVMSDFNFLKKPYGIPLLACYSYLVVLLLVTLFWWIAEDGTEDQALIVNIIPNFGKTFIAIALGALALLLKPGVTYIVQQVRAANWSTKAT